MNTLSRILRVLLLIAVGGVFLYAGISKITGPADFAHAIELYRVIPRTIAVVTALYLPWLEIVCTLALAFARLRTGALAILTLCSLVFAIMIASALARGLDISCGCFGGADNATGRAALLLSLARAAVLALACAWLLRRHVAQTAKSAQL